MQLLGPQKKEKKKIKINTFFYNWVYFHFMI